MESINIPLGDAQKLLGAASGDTALLYIYLKSGGEPAMAADALRLNEQRFSCAAATLRQLGLWQEEQKQEEAPVEPDKPEAVPPAEVDKHCLPEWLLAYIRFWKWW